MILPYYDSTGSDWTDTRRQQRLLQMMVTCHRLRASSSSSWESDSKRHRGGGFIWWWRVTCYGLQVQVLETVTKSGTVAAAAASDDGDVSLSDWLQASSFPSHDTVTKSKKPATMTQMRAAGLDSENQKYPESSFSWLEYPEWLIYDLTL